MVVAVELELLRGTDVLFTGTTTLALTPDEDARADVPLNPLAAAVEASQEAVSIRGMRQSRALSAVALFATGDTLPGVEPTWISLDPAVDVDGVGTVTSVEPGQGRVVAAHRDLSDTVSVEVLDSCLELPTIGIGDVVDGELAGGDCFVEVEDDRFVDSYGLTLSSPTLVSLQGAAQGYHPIVRIRDPDGFWRVAQIGDQGESAATGAILAPGDWRVQLTQVDPGTGPYTLELATLDPDTPGCPAIFLTSGAMLEGRLDPGPAELPGGTDSCLDPTGHLQDGYVFRGIEGRTYHVEVVGEVGMTQHIFAGTGFDGLAWAEPAEPVSVWFTADATQFYYAFPTATYIGEAGAITTVMVELDVELGTVRGTLRDETTGEPVFGTVVIYEGSNADRGAPVVSGTTSDTLGSYRVQAPAGQYTVFYGGEGYHDNPRGVTLGAGQDLQLDASLTPGFGDVTGRVVRGDNGAPLPDATVEVDPLFQEGSSVTLVTDGNGEFGVTSLRSGSYGLTVSMAGFQEHREQIYVPPGGTVDRTVSLSPQ